MARKRQRLGPDDGQRLFAKKLSNLLGEEPRTHNPALDILTGSLAVPHPEDGTLPETSQDQPAPPEKTPRGRSYQRRTVYLDAEDVDEIDALAQQWSELAQRKVSRSEVMRHALRWLSGAKRDLNSGSGEDNAGDR